MTSTLEYEERVRRGMAWLDEHAPANWRAKVNLRKFDMENPCHCVVGQVFGDYWTALEELAGLDAGGVESPSSQWEIDHGFNLPEGQDSDPDWGDLERAWVRALAADADWSRPRGRWAS